MTMEFVRNVIAAARAAVLSLRYNWGVGVLSVVLAIAFWVFVTDSDDPNRTAFILGTVSIEAVNVPADQAVLSLSEDSVRVRARAPDSVFDDLTAEDFRATVDLSGAVGQEPVVSVRVESLEARTDVVDFTPTEVTVRLEPVVQRTVPVRVRDTGSMPRGFRLGVISIDVQDAVVTGPARLVSEVDRVEADVNLAGATVDFEQLVDLQPRDSQGGDIDGVNVEPESAIVQVSIEQLDFSAAFIVQAAVSGSPAPGYNVTGIEVQPTFVVVSGPAEIFQAIDAIAGIATDPVSIDGARADVVRTVALQLPEGATVNAPGPGVTVTISIEPTEGTFGFSVALDLTNVPDGLVATLDRSTVQVTISGPIPDLSAISAGDIRAILDLAGLDAGEHTVSVLVTVPVVADVRSVTPTEVTVTLEEP